VANTNICLLNSFGEMPLGQVTSGALFPFPLCSRNSIANMNECYYQWNWRPFQCG